MFKNFGNIYGVRVQFHSNEGMSLTSTHLQNLTFCFDVYYKSMNLESIRLSDERYSLVICSSCVTLFKDSVEVSLSITQTQEILVQVMYISLVLENNQSLWFHE
jgi:hypothetical protein